MALNISEARVKQVREAIEQWAFSFRTFDKEHTPERLVSSLDDNIHWYDHGFNIVRIGHAAIIQLCENFCKCNENFWIELKSFHPTVDGAAIEQIWHGKCVNDIVRPDGDVVIKANGRQFQQYVGFFVAVSEQGKITRIDEYDHNRWNMGKAEEEYTKLGAVKD